MVQDLKYALRVLLHSKGWTAMVVLSLALGIGANTALFSATNGLLLKKLPVADPDSLVRLRVVGKNQMVNSSSDYGTVAKEGGLDVRSTVSYPMYLTLKGANQTMMDLIGGAPMSSVNVVVNGQAEIASAYIATGNTHQLLGVRTLLGRTLTPDDDRPSAPPVATISPAFWNRRFGSDPAVIGKVITANDVPVTIIGVTTPDFTGIQRVITTAPDLTLPISLDPQLNPQAAPTGKTRLSEATNWWVQVIGRLKPGITAEQVKGNLEGVFQQAARDGMNSYLAGLTPEQRESSQNRNRTDVPRLSVTPAAQGVYDNDPNTLRSVGIISGVVALILLIVCANVANLLLSRATARHQEISVRLSIGASRIRLIRQLLTESLLLALVGGALGVLVAYWGKRLLPPPTSESPIDWRVLLFAWGVALLAGLIFGLLPALRATHGAASAVLRENTRTMTGSRTLLSKSLLVVQVAMSLVLLIGAGLFLRTVENLRQVDVGFDPRNLVLFRVNPALNRYDPPRIQSLYERMIERIQAVPGVRSVTLSNPPMLSGSVNGTWFIVQGKPFSPGPHNDINRVRIAPNFFETMSIPVVAGRPFTERDNMAAPKVGIINEAAVRKFFPNESPIGQRFGSSPETSGQIEIVGIVRDVKYNAIRDAAPATMYAPYVQNTVGGMAFVIRTAGDPASTINSIREAVRAVDANVPLMDMSTQIDQIERRFQQERIFAQAYALFGGLALVVASIGLFGLMSYTVTRRTNEIGIRMALGAERGTVLGMVMREALLLVAIGVVIGVGAAMGAGRFVASLLFGLAPTDIPTSVLAILVMIAVSSLAGYLPARRASRVDPMQALRHE